MSALIWLAALTALSCVSCDEISSRDSMDGEPRTYTVSFFQFDPKELLGVDDVKSTAKKEIKSSDLKKKSKASHNKNVTALRGDMNPLDPNPRPSETEAALSLPLASAFDGSRNSSSIGEFSSVKGNLHHKHHTEKVSNTTDKVDESVSSSSFTENSKTMHAEETAIPNESSHEASVPANNTAILSKHTIKSDQSRIVGAVKNGINSVGLYNRTDTPPFMVAKSRVPKLHVGEDTSAIASSKPDSEKQLRHRQLVSQFVPIYHVSTKDHSLTYQRGSIKHPKHALYPQCHVCTSNSTYAQCVKHSTLTKCDKGLSNICYTKSHKRNGAVAYEMGCADHSMCAGARAFPCKDGSKSCFTCCQWDRCNSSPHHGNYELDELQLDQLQGSAPSGAQSGRFCSMVAIVANLIVFVLLH